VNLLLKWHTPPCDPKQLYLPFLISDLLPEKEMEHFMKSVFTLVAALSFAPVVSFADNHTCALSLSVGFIEGAPVDRFVMANTSKTAIGPMDVSFDLRPSMGRLIFDTQNGGVGVEVFQPFQSEDMTLDVADGAEGLRMPLGGLAGNASASFTIDVDDRLSVSELGQIRVSGSEMQGAIVTVLVGETSYNAVFDGANMAVFGTGCADKT
jgi:hypothetical protein